MKNINVVSLIDWIGKDLTAAAEQRPDITVHTEMGFDVPAYREATGWWADQRYYARLWNSGVHPSLIAPSPHYLATLPYEAVLREVRVMTLAEAHKLGRVDGWIKLAYHKHPNLPAENTNSLAFLAKAQSAGFDQDTPIQLSGEVQMVSEYRVWVRAGVPVSVSPYLSSRWGTWDALDTKTVLTDPHFVKEREAAARFAEQVLGGPGDHPSTMTLDVARTSDDPGSDDWVVVEANPVFSSNPYHSSLDPQVLDCLIAAGEGVRGSGDVLWEPTSWLTRPAVSRPLMGA